MTMAYAAAQIAYTKAEYPSSTSTYTLTPVLYEGECIEHIYRSVAATFRTSFFRRQHLHIL